MKNVIKVTADIVFAILLWFLVAVVLSLVVTAMAECLIFMQIFRASVRDYLAYIISIISVLAMLAVSFYAKYPNIKTQPKLRTKRDTYK